MAIQNLTDVVDHLDTIREELDNVIERVEEIRVNIDTLATETEGLSESYSKPPPLSIEVSKETFDSVKTILSETEDWIHQDNLLSIERLSNRPRVLTFIVDGEEKYIELGHKSIFAGGEEFPFSEFNQEQQIIIQHEIDIVLNMALVSFRKI